MTKATYNKAEIMRQAHTFFKANRYGTFGECLHRAWENAKAYVNVNKTHGTARTWYGWTLFGREVIHNEKAVAKVTITDPKTKNGTRVISFFTEAQTCEAGTQPPKAM